MSRKVHLDLKVHLLIDVDEDIEISEVVDELDYDFIDTTGKATVVDSSIKGHEVTDSR